MSTLEDHLCGIMSCGYEAIAQFHSIHRYSLNSKEKTSAVSTAGNIASYYDIIIF